MLFEGDPDAAGAGALSSSGSVVIALSEPSGAAAAAAAAAMVGFGLGFEKGFDGNLENHEDDAAMTQPLLLKFCTATRSQSPR